MDQPKEKHLHHYEKIVGSSPIKEIREKAAQLNHVKALHIVSFPHILKILSSPLLLLQDAGIHTDWKVIKTHSFKRKKISTSSVMNVPQKREGFFAKEYDFCFVHDVEPMALIAFRTQKTKWIWRCHGNFPGYWNHFPESIAPYLPLYDAVIAAQDTGLKDVYTGRTFCMYPSIDPLSDKNKRLEPEELDEIMTKYNINTDQFVITQISRFEPLKNQMETVKAYNYIREHIPVQLILAGDVHTEYPPSVEYWKKVKSLSGDIHVVENPSDIEVNAFQQVADVVVQPSLDEGFGLAISEALWKEKPVVASRAGGIPLQVRDKVTGFLVDDAAQCADRILYLSEHKDVAQKMGKAGKRFVKENLLVTREVLDYLTVMDNMIQ